MYVRARKFLIRRLREGELEASRLEYSLAEARHQALKAQLQPHFLFNTLHSISTLIHLDPDAADSMVIRLAALLRLNLDTPVDQLIPLRHEIAYADLYLGIEKIRFRDRLEVITDIAPEVSNAQVPSFILQPLLENAIKHGISSLARGGIITIRARRDGDWLELIVEDDGVGFRGRREGIGLSNTRARLTLLFGDSQCIKIMGRPENGTRVIIRIPYTVKGN